MLAVVLLLLLCCGFACTRCVYFARRNTHQPWMCSRLFMYCMNWFTCCLHIRRTCCQTQLPHVLLGYFCVPRHRFDGCVFKTCERRFNLEVSEAILSGRHTSVCWWTSCRKHLSEVHLLLDTNSFFMHGNKSVCSRSLSRPINQSNCCWPERKDELCRSISGKFSFFSFFLFLLWEFSLVVVLKDGCMMWQHTRTTVRLLASSQLAELCAQTFFFFF